MTRETIQATGGQSVPELSPTKQRTPTAPPATPFDDHLQRAARPPATAAPDETPNIAERTPTENEDRPDTEENPDLASQRGTTDDAQKDDPSSVAGAEASEETTNESTVEESDESDVVEITGVAVAELEVSDPDAEEADETEKRAAESTARVIGKTVNKEIDRQPATFQDTASENATADEPTAERPIRNQPSTQPNEELQIESHDVGNDEQSQNSRATSESTLALTDGKDLAGDDATIAPKSGGELLIQKPNPASGQKRARPVEPSTLAVAPSDETTTNAQQASVQEPVVQTALPTEKESPAAVDKNGPQILAKTLAAESDLPVSTIDIERASAAVAESVDRLESDARPTPNAPENVAMTTIERPHAVQRTMVDSPPSGADARSVESGGSARFVQRVVGAFRAAQDRGGEVRLRLSPPELGSLRVELTVKNGALTARLEAETQAARITLLDNLPALRDRLAEQDIKIERFDVDVRDESSRRPHDQTSGDPRSSDHEPEDRSNAESRRTTLAEQERPTADARPTATDGDRQLNVVV